MSPIRSVIVSPVITITSANATEILICLSQGGPNNMYQWRKQGITISNNSVLNISMITGSDSGVYECTVSNAAGNDTATALLTGVYSYIVITISLSVVAAI